MKSSASGKKIITTILSVLALVGAVSAGVYLTGQYQSTKTGAAGVGLSLSSNVADPLVGSNFVVAASMNTNGQNVSGTEVTIKFDSTKLVANSVTIGSALSNAYKPTVIGPGTVSFIIGAPNFGYVNGSSILLAQINFTARVAGATSISIDPTSKVSVQNQNTSQTGNLTPVQVTILLSKPTPTATPIVRPTPNLNCSGKPNGTLCQLSVCPVCQPGQICPAIACRFIDGTCTGGVCKAPTPTPTPAMCGGIRGLTCAPGEICVYPTTPPSPDMSGICQPRPTPKPTCAPRPACLDAVLACKLPEPISGWCPRPTPIPTCAPRPICLDSNPPCVFDAPPGGFCPRPTPISTCLNAKNGTPCTLGSCPVFDCAPGQICTQPICKLPVGVCSNGKCIATPPPTPTPKPIICGGLQGKPCPSGMRCIYANGTTKAPTPDATGTCQSTTTPKPGTPAPIPGDINGDGHVTIVDVGLLIDSYNKLPIPNPKADLNHDGIVSIIDVGILVDNYGR